MDTHGADSGGDAQSSTTHSLLSSSSTTSSSTPPSSSNPLSALGRMFHASHKALVQIPTSPVVAGVPANHWRFEGPSTTLATGYSNDFKLGCLDINETRTHAVLGGLKTLKTVRLQDDPVSCVESTNIAKVVQSYDWPSSLPHNPSHPIRIGSTATYDIATARSDLFDVEDVAWSFGPFRNKIAAAARTGKILLLDLSQPGMYVTNNFDHLRQVHTINFSPVEGHYLLSGSQDESIKLWDIREQRSVVTMKGRSGAVRDVQWSPTEALSVACCTDTGSVQHWNLRFPKEPIKKISAHEKTCSSISWHPDGRHLASAGHDKTCKVWDLSHNHPSGRDGAATVNIRTPHAIANVRWRPACYVRGEGMKHCVQLATSYKEKNFVHIWDARRPFLPFREAVHRMNSCTTDMLWRSIDLLWTVGPEGDFEQHDVPFTTRVLDRRPPQPLAWSPRGELTFVANAPPSKPRALSVDKHQHLQIPFSVQNDSRRRSRSGSEGQKGKERLLEYGRTPEDDGLDDKFIMLAMRRYRRSTGPTLSLSSRESRKKSYPDSSTMTPPPPQTSDELSKLRTDSFSSSLALYRSFEPKQAIKFVAISEGDDFNFLAQNYERGMSLTAPHQDTDAHGRARVRALSNAELARTANHHDHARDWELMAMMMPPLPTPQCVQAGEQTTNSNTEQAITTTVPNSLPPPTTDALEVISDVVQGQAPIPPTMVPSQHDRFTNSPSAGVDDAVVTASKFDPAFNDAPPFASHESSDFHIAGIRAHDMFHKLLEHYIHSSDFQMAATFYVTLAAALGVQTSHGEQRGEVECSCSQCYSERKVQIGENTLILPHEQIESLICFYHEQLMMSREFIAAATIRKLSYPFFPSVFEDSLVNNTIGFRCNTCRSPINNPHNKLVCETCHTRAKGCGFCEEESSPFPLPGNSKVTTLDDVAKKEALLAADPAEALWEGGERLWVICWLCGHLTHWACAEQAWADCSERGSGGKCPIYGCYCACKPGSLRDEYMEKIQRAESVGRDKVLGDEKVVGESRAVGRVRSGLGKDMKKVRLISPGSSSSVGRSKVEDE